MSGETAPGRARAGRRPAEPAAPGPRLLYLSRADLARLGIGILEVVAAVDAACRFKGQGAW